MSRALLRATAPVAAALLVLALTACEEDLPASVDPAQVDAVEAPELGACRDLTTDDIAQPSNATRVVDCTDDHTAMTYAVGSLPEELEDADYDAEELGAFAFADCSKRFVEAAGRRREPGDADRPDLGVVPPVGGGLGPGRSLVPLRRRRRRRPDRGAARPPGRREGPDAASGGRVAGLRRRADRGRFGEGAVLAGPRLAGRVDDQARRARRPLPGRPRLGGHDAGLLLQVGRAPGWATRSTTTTATPGSTRPSGTPATAGRSAGRRRASERTPYGARDRRSSRSPSSWVRAPGSDSGPEPSDLAHLALGLQRRRTFATPTAGQGRAGAAQPSLLRLRLRRSRRAGRPWRVRALRPRPHRPSPSPSASSTRVVDGHLVAVDSDRVQAQVADACPRAFEEFVGGTVEARRLSMLRPVWFTPTLRAVRRGRQLVPLRRGRHRRRRDALPRSWDGSRACLARPLAAERYAMCGTAEPGTAGFRRVICSCRPRLARAEHRRHPRPRLPRRREVRAAGQQTCQDAASAQADDPLNYQWGYEWPTEQQWQSGQHYGICWAPA